MKNFLKALAFAVLIASTPSFGMFDWFRKPAGAQNLNELSDTELLKLDLKTLSTKQLMQLQKFSIPSYDEFVDAGNDASDYRSYKRRYEEFNNRLDAAIEAKAIKKEEKQETRRAALIGKRIQQQMKEQEPAPLQIVKIKTNDFKILEIRSFNKSRPSELLFITNKRQPIPYQEISVPTNLAALQALIRALNGDYRNLTERDLLIATLIAAFDLQAPKNVLDELIHRYGRTIKNRDVAEQDYLIKSEISSKKRENNARATADLRKLVRDGLKNITVEEIADINVTPAQPEREVSAWERFKNLFRRNR